MAVDEPDWIELARQSIEAEQSEKVRKQIEHFQWLIEQRKAEIKRDMEAMQREPMTEDEVKESNPCGAGMDGCHCDSRMCRVSKGVWDLHGSGDSSFRWQDQTGGALKDDPPVLSPSQRRRRLQCLYLETSLQKEV